MAMQWGAVASKFILYNRDICKAQVRSLGIFENTGSNEAQL